MSTYTEAAYNDIINHLSNTLSSNAKTLLTHLLERKALSHHNEYVTEELYIHKLPTELQNVDIIEAWKELVNYQTTFEISASGAKVTSIFDVFNRLQDSLKNDSKNKEEYTTAIFQIFSEGQLNSMYDKIKINVRVRFSDLLLDSLRNTNGKPF